MKRILPAILLMASAVFVSFKLFPRITMKQLTIVTIPGGADLFINGVPSGMSPAIRFVPGEGVHLAASRDGFLPADTLLESIPDTVLLQLTEGTLLVINTIPAGCTIEAGNFSGSAPCSLVVFPGNPISVTAMGAMGISVTRTVNILSSGVRLLNISVPWQFTDSITSTDFVAVPRELMPYAMGPMTVGRNEVTTSLFAEFMNDVDPDLQRESYTLRGRTLLLDSIVRSNWNGSLSFNSDSTAYAPLTGYENFPITGVTPEGALWFCSWYSERSGTGLQFRLPDRDEWAFLALSGEDLPFNHSDRSEVILSRNHTIDDGWARTAPSGAMGYSAWGLGHMQGNVWEWTSEAGTAVGGSWISSIADCTAESVIHLDAELGYPFVGFRIVATGRPENIIQTGQNEMEME